MHHLLLPCHSLGHAAYAYVAHVDGNGFSGAPDIVQSAPSVLLPLRMAGERPNCDLRRSTPRAACLSQHLSAAYFVGASGRLDELLTLGAAVLKQDSPFYAYYYPLLKRGVHFEPVSRNLSDLCSKVGALLAGIRSGARGGSPGGSPVSSPVSSPGGKSRATPFQLLSPLRARWVPLEKSFEPFAIGRDRRLLTKANAFCTSRAAVTPRRP